MSADGAASHDESPTGDVGGGVSDGSSSQSDADQPVRAFPAQAKATLQKLTGEPDETSELPPGQTASEPVPDGPAKPVRPTSLGDRAADAFAAAADRLLADGEVSDERLVSGTVGDEPLTEQPDTIQAPERTATRRRSGEAVTASPTLTMPRVKNPEAVALFVHGGDVEGTLRMHRADPAFVRMVPFARDVERRSRGRIGGALLRLAVRGWNDPEKPAVEDTRWALGELRRRYPGVPIAVVGHSMGGRVALDIAASEHLAAVVGLAPWAADTYDAEAFREVPLLGVHGRHDTVTDPKATKDLVDRIKAVGGTAEFVSMPGWHAMLVNPVRWHREASTFLIDHLLDRSADS